MRHLRFSVVITAHNGEKYLRLSIESALNQERKADEIIVVDDGSKDSTRQLVEKWQTESNFPIHYIFQEHQGKHAAFNRGVQEAQGELFLSLDSDDSCVPEALERFKFHWDNIPASKKDQFSAVTVLSRDQNGNLVGDKFPCDVLDSDSIELVFKYAVKGDKWGFQRTEVLKQFPFPKVPNAKFITENVVWFALSRRFKTRFVNEVLLIIDKQGLDRLSLLGNSNPAARYASDALYYKYVLDELMDWLFRSPRNLLFSAIGFSRCSFGLGKGPSSQFRELHSLTARLLVAVSLPFGFALYHQPNLISPLRSFLQ
jgi:glycosyltransferase involved in cell wall biosynthesis